MSAGSACVHIAKSIVHQLSCGVLRWRFPAHRHSGRWREDRKTDKEKKEAQAEAERKRKGILTGREIFMEVCPRLCMNVQYCRPWQCSMWTADVLLHLMAGVQLLPKTSGRNRCCMPTVRVQSFENAVRRSMHVCGCADRGVAGEACGVAAQEGFMAQDDAGAQEAYERELDEEEDIRRMDAEAAARRAQGAIPGQHCHCWLLPPAQRLHRAQQASHSALHGCVATRSHTNCLCL